MLRRAASDELYRDLRTTSPVFASSSAASDFPRTRRFFIFYKILGLQNLGRRTLASARHRTGSGGSAVRHASGYQAAGE
jgi:hypothetical protein